MPPSPRSRNYPENLKDIRLHLIIDNVRSAYNIGSFFRTADATGCAMLHICGISAYPPNPKLEKTSLGALDTVPWAYYSNTLEAVDTLKNANIPVYAIEQTPDSTDYRDVRFPDPVGLILGHELHGVNDLALDAADRTVHIPMRGKKSSLNVATAAGIIVYEAIRDMPS
jgi:23S rRNA (guanosine2251-2'-O)-methyltransferase